MQLTIRSNYLAEVGWYEWVTSQNANADSVNIILSTAFCLAWACVTSGGFKLLCMKPDSYS